jgi:hypothetical protein
MAMALLIRYSPPGHKDGWLLALALIAAAASLMLSISTKDGQWFERSGSITTLLAAIVEFRQVARGEAEKRGSPLRAVRLDATPAGTRSREEERIATIGLWVLALGTVIWGYGQPMFHLFGRLLAML